ncbi:unnamed protein product, partial [Rangifer tarandus platyrhynchus]
AGFLSPLLRVPPPTHPLMLEQPGLHILTPALLYSPLTPWRSRSFTAIDTPGTPGFLCAAQTSPAIS